MYKQNNELLSKAFSRTSYKNLIKILKIVIGSTLAIYIADYLGLQSSMSAGVILLLTILDTSKETIKITLKRVFAFAAATIISIVVFERLGYQVFSFGIFLLIFLGCCYCFRLTEAISINVVLVTHYIIEGQMNAAIIENEAILLLIGAGIGTVFNLYMPNDVRYIRHSQKVIETDITLILMDMSNYLKKDSDKEINKLFFDHLSQHIETGISYAYANMNNTLFGETQYFIEYMEMRKLQSHILHQMSHKMQKLQYLPPQADTVAEFISHIAVSLSESNNVKRLLEEVNVIFERMSNSELPLHRAEFENRAILYFILKDLENFLELKAEFVGTLNSEQKNQYW